MYTGLGDLTADLTSKEQKMLLAFSISCSPSLPPHLFNRSTCLLDCTCCLGSCNSCCCPSHLQQIAVPAEFGSSTQHEKSFFLSCSPSLLPLVYKSFLHLSSVRAAHSTMWTPQNIPSVCELQNAVTMPEGGMPDNQKA